jgi:hypothetical protein
MGMAGSNTVGTGGEGRTRQALWAGTVAGLVGGLTLAAFNLLLDLARGRDLWAGLKLAAYPFLRDRALAPGLDLGAILQGATAHLGISVIWGVLFGLMALGMSRPATVAFGILWGSAVWIGMYFFVLPLASAALLTRGTPTVLALGQHLVFGLGLGVGFLPLQRPVVHRTVWADYRPVRAFHEAA